MSEMTPPKTLGAAMTLLRECAEQRELWKAKYKAENGSLRAEIERLRARLAVTEAVLYACETTFSHLLDTLDHDEDCPWWDEVQVTPAEKAWPTCGCWQRGVEIMRSNVREVLSGHGQLPVTADSAGGVK